MFLLDDDLCWSASDLTAAAECEYGLLRRLDVKLGRAPRLEESDDPLLAQIARLGDAHEARILDDLLHDPAGRPVIRLERARTTRGELLSMHTRTLEAFSARDRTIFQAGFFDGEFHGYADFVEWTEDGWLVSDAKLARQARPKALLQLGAYVDQLERAGLPVADTCALLLGDGSRQAFPVSDVMPVFRERRARLRAILTEHHAAEAPVAWSDDRYVACGSCTECSAAAEAAEDISLVAGLRMDQRKKLREAGVSSIAELADCDAAPDSLPAQTFENLRAQARLQLRQMRAPRDADGRPQVSFELRADAQKVLALLPAPSPGDLFFDFEGDPLYNDGDLSRWGLEYLWGFTAPGPTPSDPGTFRALWAHDAKEERAALVEFLDLVAARRREHPGMHVYHYAPYETTALKRLVAVYQTHEQELDELLRGGVFVDLYAIVRGSIRVSQPSYSIKKLEPLYMGAEHREGDVQGADASIVEYHAYRQLREDGQVEEAESRLASIADYNAYDCLSTLRLRNWLLEQSDGTALKEGSTDADDDDDRAGEGDDEANPVFLKLVGLAGEEARPDRTPEQQAYAMLASSLGYYRRERLPFWWGHFDRLDRTVDEWARDRDVFRVESAEVVRDWAKEGKQRNLRRTTRLVGEWGTGSTLSGDVTTVFELPAEGDIRVPESTLYGWATGKITVDPDDEGVVVLEESCKPDQTHDDFPIALAPSQPPRSTPIEDAIVRVAAEAADAESLPTRAAIDVLLRRPPRLADGGGSLPQTGDPVGDVVRSLTAMDSSYVAIQGPPGSGKTWTGSRVVKRLVEDFGWRIGVVAQSHHTVENLLDAVVRAGLDPALVGKKDPRQETPAWTVVKKPEAHLADHATTGCVLGGTAWTFTSNGVIAEGPLDLLVIDEAGQFALAPTIGASAGSARLLLLGDPQQLPQVSQGTHGEPVDESALGWLMDGHDTLPSELGYFLATSYRMHEDLCAPVSRLAYEGRLHSAGQANARRLDGVPAGLHVVEIDHRENRTESIEEAQVVVDEVRRRLGLMWHDPESSAPTRPLGPTDLLVVAPYNAQVRLIRRLLAEAGLSDVQVGTVDKFQGKEAPIVLVSMTASSHGDVPRGMGFLLSRNRVNVAVSRAQWQAVVVRSKALSAYMPTSTKDLLQLGAFIGLCETSS